MIDVAATEPRLHAAAVVERILSSDEHLRKQQSSFAVFPLYLRHSAAERESAVWVSIYCTKWRIQSSPGSSSLSWPVSTQFKKYILPMNTLWKATFCILWDVIFRWGCKGNLNLITLGSKRVSSIFTNKLVWCICFNRKRWRQMHISAVSCSTESRVWMWFHNDVRHERSRIYT